MSRIVRELAALRRRVARLEKEARKTQVIQVVLGEDFEGATTHQRREALRDAIGRALEGEGGN